jgi:hypothetical protein
MLVVTTSKYFICIHIFSLLNATYSLVSLLPHYKFRLHTAIIKCLLSIYVSKVKTKLCVFSPQANTDRTTAASMQS